jgi:hypothetical protein
MENHQTAMSIDANMRQSYPPNAVSATMSNGEWLLLLLLQVCKLSGRRIQLSTDGTDDSLVGVRARLFDVLEMPNLASSPAHSLSLRLSACA